VATAILPFLVAMILRLMFGKNRMTQVLLSASTVWFLANLLMAPFSQGMQRDLMNLRQKFR
jgi:hypothetical protein